MSESKENFSDPEYDNPKNLEIKNQIFKVITEASIADSGDIFFPVQYWANPFSKTKFEKNYFCPTEWGKSKDEYEKALWQTATDLATNNLNSQTQKMDEVISGLSAIHPFLEVGGALRVQVPLPKNMEELFTLVSLILNNNKLNSDKYRMPKDGFLSAGNSIPTAMNIDEGETMNKWVDTVAGIKENRSVLVWDDVAGSAGINTTAQAPNFLKLLASIIFQRNDEVAYGARGRYPAHVLRRLIDGHAYKNDDKSRTVVAFTYNTDTGFPWGYYAGLLSYSECDVSGFIRNNTAKKQIKVKIPSILLNYTFCMDAPVSPYKKSTEILTAHLIAYYSKYVTGLPVEKHVVTIHTDKSAASKSTQKVLETSTAPHALCTSNAVSETIFKTINKQKGEGSFTYDFPALDFPGLVRVDQSTVPLMDAGEEVPEPCDRFYNGIYGTYSKLVNLYSGKDIGKFLNGKLDLQGKYEITRYFPSGRNVVNVLAAKHNFNNICKIHKIDPHQVIKWLKTNKSLDISLLGRPRAKAVLGNDMRITSYFPLNFGCLWQGLNITLDTTPEKLKNDMNGDIRKAIFESLRFWAKLGNSANHYHKYKINFQIPPTELKSKKMNYVPRLTDMGFIIVGSVSLSSSLGALASEKASSYSEGYGLAEKKVSPDTLVSINDSSTTHEIKADRNFDQMVGNNIRRSRGVPDENDSLEIIDKLLDQID